MFFERPEAGSQALVILIMDARSPDSEGQEFEELVASADLINVSSLVVPLRSKVPSTYLGKGKLHEIKEIAQKSNADLIVVNKDLAPGQQRNIEKILRRRVLGRTELILNIFARRAQTHEGKLQVELAQLTHASTRLVKGWTHLDRQKGTSGRGQGSFGGLGGAGETQLEADQRLINARINRVNRQLDKVKKQRVQGRKARVKSKTRTVSLVGYTNTGKSTLFNQLCKTKVYAADQLFATLDPTIRKLEVDGMEQVILTDTVGFIRDLPHSLIDAFRATLEEVKQADLLLHIVDASAPDRLEQIQQVNRVLNEIDAEGVRQIVVYNKIDLLDKTLGEGDRPGGSLVDAELEVTSVRKSPQARQNISGPRLDRDADGLPKRVWVSALETTGLELIGKAIGEVLSRHKKDIGVVLRPGQGELRARLFEAGAVRSEEIQEDGSFFMQLRLEAWELGRLLKGSEIKGSEVKDTGITSSQLRVTKFEAGDPSTKGVAAS